MTWRVGESGGGYQARRCNDILLEEAACIRARDALVLFEGVEVVIKRVGALPQRLLKCPQCGSTRRVLYAPGCDEFACRKCHRLDYECRHSWGRDRLRTAAKLRQELGAPVPFSPLPPRPTSPGRARRFDRLAERIRQLEARSILHTQHFTQSLGRLAETFDE